ncbi:MAG TPA: hypothetical protein VLB83_05705 [Candidatus Paceibacterota bacterium]|nr:hypothetical protein [Candidatus Paceibacterota bacterium]
MSPEQVETYLALLEGAVACSFLLILIVVDTVITCFVPKGSWWRGLRLSSVFITVVALGLFFGDHPVLAGFATFFQGVVGLFLVVKFKESKQSETPLDKTPPI